MVTNFKQHAIRMSIISLFNTKASQLETLKKYSSGAAQKTVKAPLAAAIHSMYESRAYAILKTTCNKKVS